MAAIKTAAQWNHVTKADVSKAEQEVYASPERIEFYSNNANTYEADMGLHGYSGPKVAAQAIHSLFKDRPNSHLLDIGCGTGLIAEELLSLGSYPNLEGLEPATGMKMVAEEKKLYKNIMQRFLYLNCGLEHNTYDGIVSSGTFIAGHMKSNCLIELCNILKPGGYLVITLRDEYLEEVEEYRLNFQPTIDQLVKEEKWKVIVDKLLPDWIYVGNKGLAGRLFIFQKC